MTLIPWACPDDGKDLTADGEAFLRCATGHRFSVRSGIPRFVAVNNYADAFGLQWLRYRKTQLDSYSGTTISRDRLQRCLGPELWDSLDGKLVLECGCGAGRFTEILLARGARVTSVDLSEAVDANAENFPPSDSHAIAQADIGRLPFRKGQFDVVLCIGVIQHTPSPEVTIAALAAQLKPGGVLVIDHYAPSLAWWLKPAPLVRQVLKRMTPANGMRWTERLVKWFLPLHSRLRSRPLLHKLAGRVSPVLSYYRVHPELSEELQYEWALLDTHDFLTDRYKRFRTVASIRRTLESLGLESIRCERGGNGVEARAWKPVSGGIGDAEKRLKGAEPPAIVERDLKKIACPHPHALATL